MTKYYKLKKQWLGGEVTLKADTKVWFEQDSEQWYMCFHEGRIKIVKYVIDEDMLPLYFEEIKEEQPFQWSDALAEEFAKQYRFSSSRISVKMFKEGKGFETKQQTNTIPSGKESNEEGRKFLFISNDGVEIYEGDKVFWVNKRSNGIDEIYSDAPLEPPHFTNPKRDCKPSDTWAMFALRENAIEYVNINKSQPKTERIEVKDFEFDMSKEKWLKFHFNKIIPTNSLIPSYYHKLKQAIERVLNNEDNNLVIQNIAETPRLIREAEEKAFNAARAWNNWYINTTSINTLPAALQEIKQTYSTFEDYKKSQQ